MASTQAEVMAVANTMAATKSKDRQLFSQADGIKENQVMFQVALFLADIWIFLFLAAHSDLDLM